MSASFRNILQQVTQEKLEELKLQKEVSSNYFNPVLKQIDDQSTKPTDALYVLYKAIKEYPLKDIVDPVLLQNLTYVLQNTKDDPSISSQLVLAWVDKVKQEIQFSLRKCEYSYLYGSLLSEWLELEQKSTKNTTAAPQDPKNEAVLEEAASDKKVVTDNIKELMFNQPSTGIDAEEFKRFLSDELFHFDQNVEGQNVLKAIQRETRGYFHVDNITISSYDVQCCIKGLRSSDLLSQEKKEALNELNENSEALSEVASLLTNRLKNINRWEWPSTSVSVEVRRGLAGIYKPFLNEDIITALFLQYVGVQWASYFKRQFLAIYQSKVWTKAFCFGHSIEAQRRNFHESTFLSTLPDSMSSQENKTQDEYAKVEANDSYQRESLSLTAAPAMKAYAAAGQSAGQFAQHDAFPAGGAASYGPAVGYAPGYMPPQQWNEYRKPINTTATKIDFKQAFLHTLSAEIRLNQVIHSDKTFVIVQADLESFGPSIVHDCVLMTLEFFGVSAPWIGFFKKFLQPKVSFGKDEEAKTVVRGVPTSHVLSSLFGETLLFLLDFQINQNCYGMRIYRIADEFWFWSESTENVTRAWKTMLDYGKAVGLKINENRSGSVSVYSDEMLSKLESPIESTVSGPLPLPQKSIHWGYLELNSNGTLVIDQKAITKFLDEMRGLLDKSECVLEWINIFNKYLEFFIRNFGKSALVSGKQHLDQIVDSLRIIYVGLFGSEDGNPVEKLKSQFDKLNSADIVDVWAYWPLERGGLGLVNPFIGIMSLRETYVDINDEDNFKKLPLEDKNLWEELKKEHERQYGPIDGSVQTLNPYPNYYPTARPILPTWTEYIAKRETELSHWYFRYIRLLDRPSPKTPTVSERFWKLDAPIPQGEYEKNYIMWLFSYYETQLILHFGSVKFINTKLLPMSMIANIQKAKVQH